MTIALTQYVSLNKTNDRGVSEVLGYIFVFSFILAITVTLSFTTIMFVEKTGEREQLTNVERAFEILDNNMEKITHEHSYKRGTEIRVGDGDLYIGEPEKVSLSINDGGSVSNYTFEIQPIIYENNQGKLIWSNGVLIRQEPQETSVLIESNNIISTSNKLIFPIYELQLQGQSRSVSSTHSVVIQTRASPPGVLTTSDSTTMTLEHNSPYAEAYASAYEENSNLDCTVSNGNVTTCENPNTKKIVIKYHSIRAKLNE